MTWVASWGWTEWLRVALFITIGINAVVLWVNFSNLRKVKRTLERVRQMNDELEGLLRDNRLPDYVADYAGWMERNPKDQATDLAREIEAYRADPMLQRHWKPPDADH